MGEGTGLHAEFLVLQEQASQSGSWADRNLASPRQKRWGRQPSCLGTGQSGHLQPWVRELAREKERGGRRKRRGRGRKTWTGEQEEACMASHRSCSSSAGSMHPGVPQARHWWGLLPVF